MVAIASQNLSPIAITTEPIWRLSVSQYHSMIENGILTKDAKLELLEGLLVAKMSKSSQHSVSTNLIRDALAKIIPVGWYLSSQEPITLSDSEPEPDVIVVYGQTTDYRDRHPNSKDLGLVVEVSGTSLNRDRTLKQRIYASAGISIYWILNLEERQLEVYTNASESEFHQCQIFTETESVGVTLNGEAIGFISVGSLL